VKDSTQVIATYNRTAAHYAKNRHGKESKEQIKKFITLVKPHGGILDVGCAAGRDSRIFTDAGFVITGVDLSENLLAIAKSQNPDIQFILADMRSLPFADNSFDGIWAAAVLHHLEKSEIAMAIKEFQRVLRSQGVIYIETKKGQGILKTRENLVLQGERKFTLLTEEEVDALLTMNGFEKIALSTAKSKTRDLFWVNAFYQKE